MNQSIVPFDQHAGTPARRYRKPVTTVQRAAVSMLCSRINRRSSLWIPASQTPTLPARRGSRVPCIEACIVNPRPMVSKKVRDCFMHASAPRPYGPMGI